MTEKVAQYEKELKSNVQLLKQHAQDKLKLCREKEQLLDRESKASRTAKDERDKREKAEEGWGRSGSGGSKSP